MSTDVATPDQSAAGPCIGQSRAGCLLPQSHFIDGLEICVINSPAQLIAIQEQWQSLSRSTNDPNPFYNSLPFLSSLDFLPHNDWQVVTVWKPESKGKPRHLVGLLPLVQKRTRGPLSVSYWSLATHGYCFLTTPLIAKEHEYRCLDAVLTYLREQTAAGILEFPLLNTDGAIYAGLINVVRDRQQAIYRVDEFSRASLRRTEEDAEAYIKKAIGGHSLREIQRNLRRISDLGTVDFRSMSPDSAKIWGDWFLELEASGWKGNRGTALRNSDLDRRFFRTIVREGARTGATEMCGLFLNGEPIALKCNLLSDPGAYAFKIAYREDFAKYSPGIQLELENIRRFWKKQTCWMDSCATPKHFMINRLWLERRPIQHLLVSTGRLRSELLLSAMPLIRATSRAVRRGWKAMTGSSLSANTPQEPNRNF